MENKIVSKYISVVDMIAKTFGSDCEVVIHDLTTPQNSVVYTVNNHITGREIGQSFEHLVTQVLLSQNFENDCASNYYYTTPDNRIIKSSTSLLRDDEGKVVAAICINIDTKKVDNNTNAYQSIPLEQIEQFPNEGEINIEKNEHVLNIVHDIVDAVVDKRDVETLKKKEKIEMIDFLYKKGIFLIKGAIDIVADKMCMSKVTVYSYIDQIKGK